MTHMPISLVSAPAQVPPYPDLFEFFVTQADTALHMWNPILIAPNVATTHHKKALSAAVYGKINKGIHLINAAFSVSLHRHVTKRSFDAHTDSPPSFV